MEKIISCLKTHIDTLLAERGRILVAIDGNCTAGKTTLASLLQNDYDCNVFHMDDFFLRPEQRTPDRYAQPGGNVDYERFADEVLIPLCDGRAFSYRPFSCASFTLSEPIAVLPKGLNIVEGTYCQHPYFGDVYDLKLFLSVGPQLQRERVLQRPQRVHTRFFQEWIPMEALYFNTFRIPENAHILLDTSCGRMVFGNE